MKFVTSLNQLARLANARKSVYNVLISARQGYRKSIPAAFIIGCPGRTLYYMFKGHVLAEYKK